MNRNIQYAIHQDDGVVWSRVGREIAVPVLEYEKIGEGGDFTKPLRWELEAMPMEAGRYDWPRLKWTKKIPVELKNRHRKFWGMKPLATPA